MTAQQDSENAAVASAGARNAAEPRRADARRNRARVLAAAESVFAAKGITASTEDVAREAGVGIGTVFRHFPTKEALLEAVFVARLQNLAEVARNLADTDDPGAAFFAFFAQAVDQSARKAALATALADAGIDVSNANLPVARELEASLATLLARAQQAGAVRTDIGVAELIAILVGASRAGEHLASDDAARAHVVDVIADGLRPQRGG